jgi:hypothetical protein
VTIKFAGRAPASGNEHSSAILGSPFLARWVVASLSLQAHGRTLLYIYTHDATLAIGSFICQGLAAHPYSLMETNSRYAHAPWV